MQHLWEHAAGAGAEDGDEGDDRGVGVDDFEDGDDDDGNDDDDDDDVDEDDDDDDSGGGGGGDDDGAWGRSGSAQMDFDHFDSLDSAPGGSAKRIGSGEVGTSRVERASVTIASARAR